MAAELQVVLGLLFPVFDFRVWLVGKQEKIVVSRSFEFTAQTVVFFTYTIAKSMK